METSNENIDNEYTRHEVPQVLFGPGPWSWVVSYAWYRSGVIQNPVGTR